MIEFFKLLSNREISILIWTVLFFVGLIVSSKGSFENILNVIKILFSKHFIPFYIVFGLYFTIIIIALNRITIWEFSLYKDFAYWFLTTGILLFFSANSLETYRDFTNVILTAISITIILEFIIGFYNFSLVWELILIPFVTFIALLSLVAEMKKDDRNSKLVAKFLKNLLSIIGFGILACSIYNIIVSYNDFFTLSNLKSFLLPPIFTLIFLPLIYFTVLYMKYERVFVSLNRYKFLSNTRKRKIKYAIIKYANIKFKRIEKSNKVILFNKRELQNETNIKSYIRNNIKLKTKE
ncbi:hypothetical protein DFR65_104221 [Oceanihabitans sediminis]|uniref:Uncharacterized protein n=1 Tax=Oceanihabitans sediminis TaxID=1812012 RepID=A0A368P399_9FLAO|nr:hypothetical protein [Oceanihabitans sediminis]RBP30962.1 hypothetical protein DFR65_104221 [Oceanihabitans sediminis]RCU56916.1 hypothetical protein DU428_11270 [Oceanihabitans sediminis]